MVFVLAQNGQPLMPTQRHGRVRRMLKSGQAQVVTTYPFTIQLTYETSHYSQDINLGIDSGYQHVGFSAITEKAEVVAGELHLLEGQVERNRERFVYRRQRRGRLRHRKPRFENRKKPKGWIAPSLQNKLDTHLRLIHKIKSILPITRVIIEVACFDIQKIKNPDIEGKAYQQGEQTGYWNLREYVLHRDGHRCQNPDCKDKSKEPVLQIHHVGYWKGDRTDRPANLITLCDTCHKPENHKAGQLLWGWQPKVKPFRSETFMTVVRWKLVNALGCEHTYGYLTKSRRIALKLEKSHVNDAFCIAGGLDQKRATTITLEQVRRNHRCLQKFYDAKYVDRRTGEKASGQELNSGRCTRNKNKNTENLHKYRGEKLSPGRVSIRKRRYSYQPGDTVLYKGQKCTVKGVQNLGAYIKLAEVRKPVKIAEVRVLQYGKGLHMCASENKSSHHCKSNMNDHLDKRRRKKEGE